MPYLVGAFVLGWVIQALFGLKAALTVAMIVVGGVVLFAAVVFALALILAMRNDHAKSRVPPSMTYRAINALRHDKDVVARRLHDALPSSGAWGEANQLFSRYERSLRMGVMLHQYQADVERKDATPEGELWCVKGGLFFRRERPAIAFLVVRCPSTKEDHILYVPPNMKTVREARAWTFHVKPEEFAPALEV